MCVCVWFLFYFVVRNFLCSLFLGIKFSLTSKGDVYFLTPNKENMVHLKMGPRLEDEITFGNRHFRVLC